MDIGLPDMDGIECTWRLKQAMPSLRVLVLTGIPDVRFAMFTRAFLLWLKRPPI